jgi:hypothetical protein
MVADELWQPRFLSFKEALEEAEGLTPEDMADAVAQLPEADRARLAKGPKARRWDCGICDTFADLIRLLDGDQAAADLSDPRWVVYLYHEVPKARMERRSQLHYGALANEGYGRCLATYRAAGWDGEAAEADA